MKNMGVWEGGGNHPPWGEGWLVSHPLALLWPTTLALGWPALWGSRTATPLALGWPTSHP
jgi:hypothetical protein